MFLLVFQDNLASSVLGRRWPCVFALFCEIWRETTCAHNLIRANRHYVVWSSYDPSIDLWSKFQYSLFSGCRESRSKLRLASTETRTLPESSVIYGREGPVRRIKIKRIKRIGTQAFLRLVWRKSLLNVFSDHKGKGRNLEQGR